MKILITGGAGFIGSHLAEELIIQANQVVVYDNLRTGNLKNLINLPVALVKGDVLDYQSLTKAMHGCEIVFHLAALTSVVESMGNIEEYVSVNLHGTLNVLKAAKENQVNKIIFASSAAVYGDSPELPKTEAMQLNPKSPYAITKLDSEYYCGLYNEYYNLPTVCGRFFNVFGERQAPDSPYAAAIPLFISSCLKSDPVKIYGDGTQVRDFIYVKDLVKAFILLMEKGTGVFNIGYGKQVTINSVVKLIKDYLNSSSEICYTNERPGEIKNSFSSIDKLVSLGFKPEFLFENGLFRTMEYYKTGMYMSK